MPKWEYCWAKVWLPSNNETKDQKSRQEAGLDDSVTKADWVGPDFARKVYVPLRDALNALGQDGWELIGVHGAYYERGPGILDNFVPDVIYVFKRELSPN
jgi:hypothetical protein